MPSDNAAVKSKVAQYLLLNKEIADRKTMQENLKAELEPYLREADTNTRGSHVIPFSEPLEIHGKQYASLQKTKKISKVLNEERTIVWLKAQADEGQWTDERFLEPIITVEHIDQDALWDLFVRDTISQAELDDMFDVTVSWSFNPTKV